MKVYVVISKPSIITTYDDYILEKIFDSEDKAKEFVEENNKKNQYIEFFYEEYELE